MTTSIKDPNFISYIDEIRVHPQQNIQYQNKLISSVLRLTQFWDKSNNIIVPSYFRIKSSSSLVSLMPEQPSHQDASSQTEILFSQDVPIVSVLSDFLCVNEKEILKSDKKISWKNVINALLNEVNLYNINKEPINPQNIFNLESIFINETDAATNNDNQYNFLQTLGQYFQQYFTIDAIHKIAKLNNREYIKIRASTAQRAITPFVFNNCKQGCRFCYIDRGLSAIKYPRNWCRKLEDIDKILEDYDVKEGKSHPILRFAMMDWEPTEHPKFFEILQKIAHVAPTQQIPIVTHGGALTPELLSKIADDEILKRNVLFQVSLNSANVFYRHKLMPGAKLKEHQTAIKSIELMDKMKINFDVSIVAATNIIPMSDIIETIKYVDNFTPHSYIRVALPTATKHHNPKLLRTKEELCEIENIITSLRPTVKAPIITTVALENRNGLNAVIEEVIPNSAADLAGIESGDEIISIDGSKVRSRTEANLILSRAWYQKKENISMEIKKNSGKFQTYQISQGLEKNDPRMAGERAVGLFGLLIHDDVDFGIFEKIAGLQKKYNLKYPHIFTGKVIEPFFEEALSKLENDEKVTNLHLNAVENKYFGGNVSIAGLLTFGDLYEKFNELKAQKQNIDAIFISQSMLSRGGFDLKGIHINEFMAQCGIPIFAIKARTGSI